MDVPAVRSQIPATSSVTYLNTGYSGPSPRPVVDAITQFLELQAAEGPTTPHVLEKSRALKSAAREAFARLMNADLAEIVLTDNTTRGINIVVGGLPWEAGDEVVTSTTEHFAGLIPLYELRRRFGAGIRFVDLNPQDSEDRLLEKLEEAITARTRLLLLSHIMFTTGLCLPAARIQKMAKEHGVPVLFDAAQCSGQIPLDMHGWGCDYYAVPAHKWMLGPWGVGALYIRRELIAECTPSQVSSRAALTFDTRGGYEPELERQEKFEVSTVSPALHAGAVVAVEHLMSIGMDQVQGRWRMLTERLRKGLREVPGATVTSPPGGPTASGLVTFTLHGQDPQGIVDELWKRERVVVRPVAEPAGVRVSVDFFNTEEEMDRVAGLVRELAATPLRDN